MLDITLLVVGKIRDKNIDALIKDYVKRLKVFVKLKIIEVEAVSFSDNNQEAAKRLEAERLVKVIDKEEANAKGAVTYLLAERGQELSSSPEFAAWLNQHSPLILVLGGSLGFSDDLYKSYRQLSLSPLTFSHEMARLIFLEQLYRSALIIKGKKYHY